MPKTYKYQNAWFPGEETEIWFSKEQYMDGTLALEAWSDDDIYPYMYVTICLSRKLKPNEAYVDTNDNAGIDRWLEKNGIAEFTEEYGQSNHCTYPLMRFDLTKI